MSAVAAVTVGGGLATAIGGTAGIVAGVGGGLAAGAYGLSKQNEAEDRANAQLAQADSQLGFEKAKYNQQVALNEERQEAWDDLYGNTEENLARSMSDISARVYEVTGHTDLEREYQEASRRLTENLAARNIKGGAQVAGQTQLLSDLASDRAQVSSTAERQALADKTNMFTSLGLSQKPGANVLPSSAGMANANLGVMSGMSNQAEVQDQIAAQQMQGIGAAAGALGTMFSPSPSRTTSALNSANSSFGYSTGDYGSGSLSRNAVGGVGLQR